MKTMTIQPFTPYWRSTPFFSEGERATHLRLGSRFNEEAGLTSDSKRRQWSKWKVLLH